MPSKQRKILLPVDGSKHSTRAYKWAAKNLIRKGDTLFLVHVVEPEENDLYKQKGFVKTDSTLSDDEFVHFREKVLKERAAVTNRFHDLAESDGITDVVIMHVGHDEKEYITDIANKKKIDIIVIGNRGLSELNRSLVGSVSDFVLEHTDLPVVIVPPPK